MASPQSNKLPAGRLRSPSHAANVERRFRDLLQDLEGIVWEADAGTLQFLFVSQRAEEILGYPVKSWLGEPEFWTSHIHPDDLARAGAFYRDSQAHGAHREIEYRMLAADGRVVWLRDLVRVIRDEAGQPSRLRGVMVDITGRKEADAELEARAEQQEAVAEFGQRALAGIGVSSLVEEAVRLVARVLRVEYSQLLELQPDRQSLLLRAGVGWREGCVGRTRVSTAGKSHGGYTLLANTPVLVEDLRTETRFQAPALLAEHGIISGLSVIVHGPLRPFGVLGAHTSAPRKFTENEIHFLQAIANVLAAVLERKRVEDALRQNEQLYRTIARNIPRGAIALFDKDLRYLLADGPQLPELAGVSKDVVEGKTIWQTFPASTCELLAPAYRAALEGKSSTIEISHNRRFFLTQTVPLRDERGQITAGMAMTGVSPESERLIA